VPQGIVASPPESFSAREAIASVASWARALEKVRSRQADIKMRTGAGKIEKTDLNGQIQPTLGETWHASPPVVGRLRCDPL
jgi:hypothetical protein